MDCVLSDENPPVEKVKMRTAQARAGIQYFNFIGQEKAFAPLFIWRRFNNSIGKTQPSGR